MLQHLKCCLHAPPYLHRAQGVALARINGTRVLVQEVVQGK